MLKMLTLTSALMLALAALSSAQNSNTSTPSKDTQPKSTQTTPKPTTTKTPETGETPQSRTRRTGNKQTGGASDPTSKGVLAAFGTLVEGIQKADVDMVTGVYWNSPQLTLFNNNGTVTRGWEQMRKNRESSYPEMKNVRLEIRDQRVLMLGRDAAVVTCLWTQSQTFRGTSETASGRMTLVFQRIGGTWKAVHLHTSPDAPDPSRVAPSEQMPKPKSTPQ